MKFAGGSWRTGYTSANFKGVAANDLMLHEDEDQDYNLVLCDSNIIVVKPDGYSAEIQDVPPLLLPYTPTRD